MRQAPSLIRSNRLIRSKRQRALLMMLGCLLVSGCGGKPSAANIQLRKDNQQLVDRVTALEAEKTAMDASIKSLEQSIPTVPVLQAERLNELFTASALKLLKLSGKADLDPAKPGDDGIKIYVVPLDAAGDEIKSAGSFRVEAFDLTAAETRVGQWDFSINQARANWNGSGLLYEYVLPCPFETMPQANELTIRVVFTDALTQRVLSIQQVIKMK